MVALVFVSLFLMQATRNGSDAWLSYWVDSTATSSRTQDVFFYLVSRSVSERVSVAIVNESSRCGPSESCWLVVQRELFRMPYFQAVRCVLSFPSNWDRASVMVVQSFSRTFL